VDATAHTHQMAPHIVIAHYDETGKPALTQDVAPAEMSMGTLTGVASIWQSPAVATIPGQVGTVSADPNFAVPGQVKSGRSWIGPAKDGELDFTGMTSGPMIAGADPKFHRTDTLDLGFITAGEAELKLENGDIATLRPGSSFVITGMQHSWHVLGDIPFKFVVFTVGAHRTD